MSGSYGSGKYSQQGNSSSQSISVKQIVKLVVAGVLGIFLISALFGSYHIVPPGHRGVAVTAGMVGKDFRGEGLTFKLPFFTTIYNVEVRQKTISGTAPCFSSDLQSIKVVYNVLYKVHESKVVKLYQEYAGDAYHTLVEPKVQQTLKAATALHPAEDLVKNREVVRANVLASLKKEVGDLVYIEDVVINDISLTPELEKAIELKVIRQQEAQAKEFEKQKAIADAEITGTLAKAEANAIKLKAEALKTNPEALQLEIVRKWNGVSPTSVTIVQGNGEGKSSPSIVLPLK